MQKYYKKIQNIINMMNSLNMLEYKEFTLIDKYYIKFLEYKEELINFNTGDYLNYSPKTSLEILEEVIELIDNDYFYELEQKYNKLYNKKNIKE